MKLSIIVPVYNMEKYIEKCIDSILEQTYKDYEVILVDDGSSDRSSVICDKYVKNYDFIKVIHKNNGGTAESRNVGLSSAKGEYIFFMDSDDFFNEKYAFDKIVKRIEETNVDILNFGFRKYFEEKDKSEVYFKKENNDMPTHICKSHEAFKYLIKRSLFVSSPWNKVINRNLFYEHNLSFKKGIYSEDVDWCGRLAIVANSFDFISEDFYSYRQRQSSISKNMSDKNIRDLKNSIITCCKYAKNLDGNFKYYFLNYVSYQYGTFLVCQGMVNYNSNIQLYIDEMEYYQYLLNYKINNKVKVLYYLKRLIGYRNLCNIIRKFYGLKNK